MADIGWRFPELAGGTRQGYTNNDIEIFKGEELIDNLAREICQNSLDARLNDGEPVKVVFELRHVPKNRYKNVFSEYERCLTGCSDYWGDNMDTKLKRFVVKAKSEIAKPSIPVLVASDYNTTGLSGSHDGSFSSAWEALTGSEGVSSKSEGDSAGSYGVGKNAPFACSSLSMVFYNTLAENNERAFMGVAKLATLLLDGVERQKIGKYQNRENGGRGKPIYSEDKDDFRDCFIRNDRGTDIIIVGFTQPLGWMDSVEKAVLKNFLVAISEGRLVVELKEDKVIKTISRDVFGRLLDAMSGDTDMIPALQLYKAFTEPDIPPAKLDILESGDVEVYVKADSSYRRTIANFRNTGMLVGTYYRRIFQHYAAVVVVRGRELSELLKDTEPPRHNAWDYRRIDASDGSRRKRAKEAIEKIKKSVLDLLRAQYDAVTERMVDAAGVAEYLPDNDSYDGMDADQASGDDLLRPKIKIAEMKSENIRRDTVTRAGIRQEGTVQPGGNIHNATRNPNLPPGLRPPVLVVHNPEEPDRREGVGEGGGPKTVVTEYSARQRAFPLIASQGRYKIVLIPEKSHEKLYVECFACGEDGKLEKLSIENFMCNGRSIRISGGKAGPIKVEAGAREDFIVAFTQKEKMQLSLQLTEDV